MEAASSLTDTLHEEVFINTNSVMMDLKLHIISIQLSVWSAWSACRFHKI